MPSLAAGRNHDMARLIALRSSRGRYTAEWNKVQLKIDDLIEEGHCPIVCRERERLVRAAQASDGQEIVNISEIINQHMETSHRARFTRSWLKKG